MDDSQKLIVTNAKEMQTIYNSDLNPQKQLATI